MKLYELSGMYKELQENAEDFTEQEFVDFLNNIRDELKDKCESMAMLIKELEGQVTTLKTEEKRLADRRKALDNKVAQIKEYIEKNLLDADIKKLKTDKFSFSIQKNPPSLLVLDADKIPVEYKIAQMPVIDKKAIMDDIRHGCIIGGVEVQQKEGLRIR